MRLKHAWQSEALIAASFCVVALLVGLVAGNTQWWLLLGVTAYFARLIIQIAQFTHWLQRRDARYPPEAAGIFGALGQIAFNNFKEADAEQARLTQLVDEFTRSAQALPDSIVILDARHQIRWCNAAASRLLGITPKTDRAQSLENFVRHPTFIRYLRDGDFSASVTIPAPSDPELALSVHVVPYGGDQHVLVARDVTESLRIEKVRRDFVSNVSHELRTPITILKGHLERLRGPNPPEDERLTRSYDVMSKQTARLAGVVEDLLLLSRVESVDTAPNEQLVDMAKLLPEIAEEASVLSADRHTIVTSECDVGTRIWGDYEELRIAFSNLLRNAVQYCPTGGRIEMRWQSTQDGAVFSVFDSGDYIEPKHIPRLTERFYRADTGRSRDTGGTGLGLAIVKHILNHYDGALEIVSEPNVGNTFRCHFPADVVKYEDNVVALAAS
ncbi:MAG: phosphate regulon sensor histidine kinase PhoR [Gammaproteobacteria bacterium]|nr:phosphate regulon sensor histidine kinase PhoR [Gammaproteobacteria bacterium]